MIYKVTLAILDKYAGDIENEYSKEELEKEIKRVIKDELMLDIVAILIEEAQK